jgi:hypothetical protein
MELIMPSEVGRMTTEDRNTYTLLLIFKLMSFIVSAAPSLHTVAIKLMYGNNLKLSFILGNHGAG